MGDAHSHVACIRYKDYTGSETMCNHDNEEAHRERIRELIDRDRDILDALDT